MKNTKRLLAVILALAVLLVSLPMTLGVAAAEVPDALDNTAAGDLIYSYDFDGAEYASSGSIPSELIYGGAKSDPALSFGWGADNASTSAYMNTYDGKTVLTYATSNCDAVLLAPDVNVKNYVYEATFYSTNSTANAGICNLSWGDTIDSVPGAVWFVAKPSTYVSIKGKDSGSGVSVPSSVDNKEIMLTENGTSIAASQWHTFKMICYEGVNYYFIDDVYYGSLDVSSTMNEYTTGGRVGIYTYGSTVHVSDMAVYEYGEIVEEETLIWDGTFDAANLPTEDADGDGEIEITTPEQFAAVASSTGLDADGNRIKYELTKDIYLNDTTVDGWKDNSPNKWIPPVTDISTATVFNGIINGNGHVVRGMYLNATVDNDPDQKTVAASDVDYLASAVLATDSATEYVMREDVYAGLFPVIGQDAGLIGIGVEDAYVSVKDSREAITLKDNSTKAMNLVGAVGALVGAVKAEGSNSAIIDQCYADSSVELIGARAGFIGSGIVGGKVVISNSYSECTATVFKGTSGSNADGTDDQKWDNNAGNRFMLVSGGGGIVDYATIYSCYTLGNVANNGAFTKNVAAGSSYINVYYFSGWTSSNYATAVDGNNIKGDGAKTYMPNLAWDKFQVVTDARPTLSIFTTHTQASGSSVWNGTTTDSSATDSDGDGYVEVRTANQLAYAIKNSVSAELMNDIWINDITVYAKGGFYLNNMNKAANEWLHNSYSADFNGNGYVVHGVFYDTEPAFAPTTSTAPTHSQSYSGLIPATGAGSAIEKVGVEDSFLRYHSNYSLGAIVGHFGGSGVSIDRSYVGESVYIHGYNGVGGVTGGGSGGTQTKSVTNCYSLATLLGTGTDGRVGGIVGNYWTANNYTVKYCYTNHAQVVGNASSSTVWEGNYATNASKGIGTKVTNANMMGDAALTNMADLNAQSAYSTTMGYPMLKIFDPDYVEEEAVGEVWNGSIAMSYADGTGTEEDPYIISKGSQLARAVNLFGENGAYFKLDRDIYLNDVTKADWKDSALGWFESITETDYAAYKNMVSDDRKSGVTGIFNGNIDGNGFHIYGVYYADGCGSTSSALFPVMNGGSVKNLGLDYFHVDPGTGATAGIAAFTMSLTDTIEVDNVYVGANCLFDGGDGKAAGGFFGYIKGTSKTNYINITNSYALVAQSALTGQAFKSNAFIGETWLSYYKVSNAFSLARPFNPTTEYARASQFCVANKAITAAIADTFKNVYTSTDIEAATESMEYYDDGNGNVIYSYTNVAPAMMRGANALDNMNINGDGAFLYNIGYPSLVIFGNDVPTEDELVAGLVNIATAMPMTEYTADTKDFIISGSIATGKAVSIALNDTAATALSIAADGNVTLSSGDETVTKALTLGDTAEYKLAIVSGFAVAFVDGEFVGLVGFDSAPGYTATFTGFDLDNDSICVDLYVADVTFDGVDYSVDLQLKDLLGNTVSGGIRVNTTLTESEVIENLGFEVEYGVLVSVSEGIPDDITADDANDFTFNSSTDKFEFTGLSTAKQELFFALRGYAKITVNEDIEYYYYADDTSVFSPIYEANDLYENETYTEAIKAVYGASDKFIENLTQEINFALFADYHYKEGMYTSQLSDLKAIVATADSIDADFIFSLGDMSNDMVNAKEITNYLLDGTWTDANGTVEDTHSYAFYNIYGNHELETAGQKMQYVNSVLTNSEVHWGDGSVGAVSAATLSGTATRKELEASSYYWYEVNGIRIIAINTNFSWNPNHIDGEVVGWEHNLDNSYGGPSAATNAGRGFDEGTAALANIRGNHLGDVQMAWLEATLMDAVEQGTPCIVMGHDSVSGQFGQSSAAAEVRALYAKANAIRTGTVIASFNGHLHTNRQAVVDDVLYLDINTVRNSWWQGGTTENHYDSTHTFSYDTYDDDGNYVSSSTKSLTELSQHRNTWFANDPVHCTVRITQTGTVELSGMTSSWMYEVVPEKAPDYAQPEITSGSWTLGDAAFTVAE